MAAFEVMASSICRTGTVFALSGILNLALLSIARFAWQIAIGIFTLVEVQQLGLGTWADRCNKRWEYS